MGDGHVVAQDLRTVPDALARTRFRRRQTRRWVIVLVGGLVVALGCAGVLVVVVDRQPEPSLTDAKIIFSRAKSGDMVSESETAVMNANGTGQRRVGTGLPLDAICGGKVAFHARDTDSGRDQIILSDFAGGPFRQLTQGPARNFSPACTPDGSMIAFARDGDEGGIYVMMADGGEQRRLTAPLGQVDSDPAWSPDGSRIAFARADPEPRVPPDPQDIFVINTDGTDLRRLTTSLGVDRHPVWSPDGTQIVFESGRDRALETRLATTRTSTSCRPTGQTSAD